MKKKPKKKESTVRPGFIRLTFDAPKEFVERLKADAQGQRVPAAYLLRELLIVTYPPRKEEGPANAG